MCYNEGMTQKCIDAVRLPARKSRVREDSKYKDIELRLLAQKSWTDIQQELGCSRSTIATVSKSLGDFSAEIKAEWQRRIDAKMMMVAEKLVESMAGDDMNRLATDRKAIALGILHDKTHPKSAAPLSVSVTLNQTLDIARNASQFKDI